MPEQGHALRVAPEVHDVLADPRDGGQLVEEPLVACHAPPPAAAGTRVEETWGEERGSAQGGGGEGGGSGGTGVGKVVGGDGAVE